MAKAKKKSKSRTEANARKCKKGLVGKTTGRGIIETWLTGFHNKKLKTAKQVTEFMKTEFPGRDSDIFNYPNVVVARANRGLLTHGKKPNPPFKKYPVDKKPKNK